MLSKQQTIDKLKELEKLHNEVQYCFNKLGETFGMVFGMDRVEGAMRGIVNNLIDSYADIIAECSGIPQEALTWWILEAEWGEGN